MVPGPSRWAIAPGLLGVLFVAGVQDGQWALGWGEGGVPWSWGGVVSWVQTLIQL